MDRSSIAPGSVDPAAPVWVLTGPTAAGKSALAMRLAEREDLEILSMDSMAVYRRMDIGTAKPTAEERARIPHHLIDIVDPDADFDTNRWCAAAQAAVAAVRARGRQPLFVGGTPLYLMAFFKGMVTGPPPSVELRAQLRAQEAATPGSLHAELAVKDPAAAERIHHNDEKRLVRALEYFALTGKRISAQREHFAAGHWQVPCRIAAVARERADLHERVQQRTRSMLAAGLLDEVRAIRDGSGFSRTARAAIGYAECLRFLAGDYKDEEELRNMIRRHTHRLIRRQLTWLRRIRELQWFPPDVGVDELRARFVPAR